MNEDTAEAVAKFIIKSYNGKKVSIQWFGGEPLCNISAIDKICTYLTEHKISYKSTMTTNGYLFDNEVVKKSVDVWNLQSVQITLDGLAETYNKVKN